LPHPLGDIVLKKIELEVIENREKESLLDDYLQRLRWAEAVRVQASSKGVEKPVREKPPLSLHRQLGDLPQVVMSNLVEIEQVISPKYPEKYVWDEIERLAWEYKITTDLNILSVALDYYKRAQDPRFLAK
jgi:hypothetical protein